ncbi:MAG: hypothetical protein ACLSGS_07675 [Adlercreutzia sp.]
MEDRRHVRGHRRCCGHRWAVQLTGGEPTCRKDLPEIIRMGREGFWASKGTNGLVTSRPAIWNACGGGAHRVYLSFDGTTGTCTRPRVGATF